MCHDLIHWTSILNGFTGWSISESQWALQQTFRCLILVCSVHLPKKKLWNPEKCRISWVCDLTLLRKSVIAAKHLGTISVKNRCLGASVNGPLLILPFINDLRDAFIELTLLLANDINKITRCVWKLLVVTPGCGSSPPEYREDSLLYLPYKTILDPMRRRCIHGHLDTSQPVFPPWPRTNANCKTFA